MIQAFEFGTPDGLLRIERVYQDINVGGPVADEKWRYTDRRGHGHAYSRRRGRPYPTLTYKPGPVVWCNDCCERHEDQSLSWFECRACGEVIEPGARPARNPEAQLLVQVASYLDGELVDRERAERALSAMVTLQQGRPVKVRIA